VDPSVNVDVNQGQDVAVHRLRVVSPTKYFAGRVCGILLRKLSFKPY